MNQIEKQNPELVQTLVECISNAIKMNWSKDEMDILIRTYASEASKEE